MLGIHLITVLSPQQLKHFNRNNSYLLYSPFLCNIPPKFMILNEIIIISLHPRFFGIWARNLRSAWLGSFCLCNFYCDGAWNLYNSEEGGAREGRVGRDLEGIEIGQGTNPFHSSMQSEGLSVWSLQVGESDLSQTRVSEQKECLLGAHVFLSESSCELSLSALLVRPSPGKSQCHFLCPLLVETKLEKERKKK